MTSLLTSLADWRPFRVLVVGDFMLDQNVYGDAERLTADAPVPVLAVRHTEENPGGAANVCMDLVALHGQVRAFGIVGNDDAGRTLRSALERAGIGCAGLLVDQTRPTTVKRSLIGLAQHRHPQKMFRLDFESKEPISRELQLALLKEFDGALRDADIVAIEDYGKGVCCESVCQAIIAKCRAAGKQVLIDPASMRDYGRYRHASAITPNRSEAELATGLRTSDSSNGGHNAQLALALRDSLDLDAVILTLDRHGSLLLERGGEPVEVPTVARQVYDVTGAGDMVLAALLGARANNIGWPDAARFANTAAGLEVEIFGCKPIPFERIYAQVISEGRRLIGKRRTLQEAIIEVEAARREGKSVVFTNGCFDIIHAGHISLLRRAAQFGDLLVVGLNNDESVRRLKGESRPVHLEDDRAAVLGELESVDIVVTFEEDTPMRLLEAIRPNVLVKGGDYTKDKVIGGTFVESYGGRIELIDLVEGRSTSEAIRRIRAS